VAEINYLERRIIFAQNVVTPQVSANVILLGINGWTRRGSSEAPLVRSGYVSCEPGGENKYTYKNVPSSSRCLSDVYEHRRTTRVTSLTPHKYRARNELVVVWLRSWAKSASYLQELPIEVALPLPFLQHQLLSLSRATAPTGSVSDLCSYIFPNPVHATTPWHRYLSNMRLLL
jgi:hypothetical protein